MRFIAASLLAFSIASVARPSFAEEDKKPQNFVYLKPMMFPVIANGAVQQMISVTITLEMDDAASADKVQAIQPRIVDAYMQDLYGAIDNHHMMRSGVLDASALKATLEASNARILGSMPCHVLLQNIGQRVMHETASAS